MSSVSCGGFWCTSSWSQSSVDLTPQFHPFSEMTSKTSFLTRTVPLVRILIEQTYENRPRPHVADRNEKTMDLDRLIPSSYHRVPHLRTISFTNPLHTRDLINQTYTFYTISVNIRGPLSIDPLGSSGTKSSSLLDVS